MKKRIRRENVSGPKICAECGEKFYIRDNEAPCQFQKRTHCSIPCRNRANARKQTVMQKYICQRCGARLKRANKSNLCRTCHDALSLNSWWTLEQVGFLKEHYAEHGPRWVADRLDLDPIKVRDKANRMGLTMNPETYYKVVHLKAKEYMLNHNPMKDPDVVKKVSDTQERTGVRERTYQKLLAGQQRLRKSTVTKIQRKLYSAMSAAGIEFEPEYLIKPKFIVDAAMPKHKIIIQADGCYWHGHNCRGKKLTRRQASQQARDRAQDKYLQSCGWTVLRFWGCEINSDIDSCIRKILTTLDTE